MGRKQCSKAEGKIWTKDVKLLFLSLQRPKGKSQYGSSLGLKKFVYNKGWFGWVRNRMKVLGPFNILRRMVVYLAVINHLDKLDFRIIHAAQG